MNELSFQLWPQKYDDVRFPVRITVQSLPVLVAPHLHDKCVELMLILSGSARVRIGVEELVMRRGDVAFVPQYALHRADALEDGSRLLGLCYDDSILEAPLGATLSYLLRSLSTNALPFYESGSELAKKIGELARHVYREFDEKRIGFEWGVYADVYQISLLVLRDLAEKQNFRIAELQRGLQRILPTLEAIDRRYAEQLSISALAAEQGLSVGHFTRLFRRIMRQSPVKYINDLRVRRSLYDLSEGKLSISEVAERAGFLSQSYYNRVFHAVMKLSPMQYRRGTRLYQIPPSSLEKMQTPIKKEEPRSK